MTERRLRVLAIASHPVQYGAPVFRLMAQHPRLDFQVAYCSMRGAEATHDPEFGTTVKWDVPILDGYRWTHVPNRGPDSVLALRNPGLWPLIRLGHFDAILCYISYRSPTFWIAYFAAKLSRTAFLFGTDAVTLTPLDRRMWKRYAKRLYWPLLFRCADQVIVPSSGTFDLMLALGIPADRITLTPYTVDNEWWTKHAAQVDRSAVRATWGAGPDSTVILFCAKLQPWKRPADLLRAFAKANLPNGLLVFAGEGPVRPSLEAEALSLGIREHVRFAGFFNQSQLPAVYTAADLLVLPSEYDAFGVVVNEALLCGCPVAASDHVGAARDLIAPICPEFVFRCGDIDALAAILKKVSSDRSTLREAARRGTFHMTTWSTADNVAATVKAIELAIARVPRHGRKRLTDAPLRSGTIATALLTIWIVSSQVWYYLQFSEQFRMILRGILRHAWR
jgi:glycosyltransferase involved in cell wall biosynthesis